MKRGMRIKEGKHAIGSNTYFVKHDGLIAPVFSMLGKDFVKILVYEDLDDDLYDRTDELAAANKALAEERKESDFEKRTHRSTMDKLREAWGEIKALKKAQVKAEQMIFDQGITIGHLECVSGEKPAPAPVEYECPGCGNHIIGEHDGRKENKYLVCVGCGEQSGRYKRGEAEGPPESWIKKQEKPAPAPVKYECPECRSSALCHQYGTEGEYFAQCSSMTCVAKSGNKDEIHDIDKSWIKKQEEPSE